MTSTNIGQRIGAAGNQAAIVLTGAAAAGVSADQIVKLHGDLTADFVKNMETIQEGLEAAVQVQPVPQFGFPQESAPLQPQAIVPNGAAMIQNAFAGTQAATPAEVQQHFGQAAQVPAAIPGAVDGDAEKRAKVAALWQEFFQDPSKFYDNRYDKKHPQGPDFKHKDKKNDKGQGLGLWRNDRLNPDWVAPQLAAIGMS